MPRFAYVERFPVNIAGPTRSGALLPHLDDGDLMLRSAVADRLTFQAGGNVASLLIFDIDPSRTVASVEVLVSAPRWRVTMQAPPASLQRPCDGRLVVPVDATEVYMDTRTPQFHWHAETSQLHIEIEPVTQRTKWVRLSHRCYALINEVFLAGFLAEL